MNIVLFTDNIDDYLKEDSVIDYGNEIITQLADTLFREADGEVVYIKKAYEFVLQSRTCWLLCYDVNLFQPGFAIKN